MKLGIQLSLLAYTIIAACAEDYIGFFGDGEFLSSGLHLAASPGIDQPGELITRTIDTEFIWNEETGELISSEDLPQSESQPYGGSLDWEEANIVAYSDHANRLILLRRHTGELIKIHRFGDRIVSRIYRVSNGSTLAIFTRPAPPEDDSYPFYAEESNSYHLIDTRNGEIVRSFNPGRSNRMLFLPINEGVSILALAYGPSRTPIPSRILPSIPGSFDVFGSTTSIHIINAHSGSDEITPIQTDDPFRFSGAAFMDRDTEIAYAIIQPGLLHKIDLNNFTASETPIPESSGVSQLILTGDTLIALFYQTNGFEENTFIASWNKETLVPNLTIDALQSASNPSISAFIPIPGSSRMAVANQNGEIELWNYAQSSFIQTIGNTSEAIRTWSISPDTTKLLTLSSIQTEKRIQVWDLQNGGSVFEKPVPLDSPNPYFAYFTSDSQKIISYDSNGKLVAHRISNGELAYSIPESANSAIACGYYGNGSMRMIVHSDGTVQKLDSDTIVSTFQLEDADIIPYQINPTNGFLLYQTGTSIKRYDPATNAVVDLWDAIDSDMPDTALLNPDANRLILYWGSGTSFQLGDIATPGFPTPTSPSRVLLIDLQNENKTLHDETALSVENLALSPNGERYAIGTTDPFSIYIHETDTGSLQLQQEWPDSIEGISFSSNGSELFILSDNQLHRLETSTGDIISVHNIASQSIPFSLGEYSLLPSPNGKLLALSNSRFNFRIFQLPNFQELELSLSTSFPPPLPLSSNSGFAFSPNGTHFLSIDFLSYTYEGQLRTGAPINGTLANFKKATPVFSFPQNPGSEYRLQESSNLIEWRYSTLAINDRIDLPGFPILPDNEQATFSKIIEFPKPEQNN